MRHDICITGAAFQLRPVEIEDAAFMVELRADPELCRYINPTSPHVKNQIAYIVKYFDRPGDYYFIVERIEPRTREGMISIYDIDEESRVAEWGRWILRRSSFAAVESVLLAFRVGFEVLHLDLLFSRTVADNVRVVSFHDSCGAIYHARLKNYVTIDGQPFDSIEHHMTREIWPDREGSLAEKAAKAAALLARASKSGTSP